jgi:phosphonate transport system substrate-binding protein
MRRVLSKWSLVGFLAVMQLISPTPLWAEESLTLSIGIVPQQNATKLARLWTPICNYLSQQTGYRFVFKTAKDIPTFENRLAAGEYDIAYMNPYHYTVFSIDPGYPSLCQENQ